LSTTRTALSSAAVEREKAVLAETAKASGKPEPVIAKMIEGGLRKYFEDIVLLEQTFAIDGKSKVKDVVAAAEKDVGAPVKVAGFVRMALGEGVEAAAEYRLDQGVLGAEVIVHRREVDLGLGGELAHRGALEPVLHEKLLGRVEDAGAGFVRRLYRA